MNIAEKIRRERKKIGISQESLGEQLGVSRQAITKWENGLSIPDTEKVILLSEFFSVTTDYLLKDYIDSTEPMYPNLMPEKNETSWRLRFGIPMFNIAALVLLAFWYLSIRYPIGFFNWDGTVTAGFWGFLEFHGYLYECLTAIFIGAVGLIFILSDIFIKKHFKKAFIIWLRKRSWVTRLPRAK